MSGYSAHKLSSVVESLFSDEGILEVAQSSIATIEKLASSRRTGAALKEVRSLAVEYKATTLLSCLKEMQASTEGDPKKTKAPNTAPLSESTPDSEIRIELYRRNPDAQLQIVKNNLIAISAPKLNKVSELDHGYGYKGGAARLALFAIIGDNVQNFIPRDLDLVRISTRDSEKDHEMAKTFMPDDFEHGHGVEIVASIDRYLNSRDIRINEVLLINKRIFCSKGALIDALNGFIRPTDYIKEQNTKIPGKIVCKMLRLQAESLVRGRPFELKDFPANAKISHFGLALHLNRALEQNSRVASWYLKLCIEHGFIEQRGQKQEIGDIIENLKHLGGKQVKKLEKLKSSKKRKGIKL